MDRHEHTQPRCYMCYPLSADETRLINAAPALLEALEAYIGPEEHWLYTTDARELKARAAIVQARGQA